MPTPPRRTRRGIVVVALLLTLALPSLVTVGPVAAADAGGGGWQARAVSQAGIKARDRKLAQTLPQHARVGYHPQTGRVRFISGTPERPLAAGLPAVAAGQRRLRTADARAAARRFVDRYGAMFGLRDPARELRVRETTRRLDPASGVRPAAGAGRPHAVVRFGQVRAGVEVMGGEVVVQLTEDGEVVSATGEVIPSGARAPVRPRVSASQARRTAATWIARETRRARAAVRATSEGLAQYDPRVMDDPALRGVGVRLVWRIGTFAPTTPTKPADRRLVVVDARSGDVLTTIGRIATAGEGPNRRICDNRNVPGKAWTCSGPYARVEGQPRVGVGDVDAVYRLMGVTYDFFADRFGRDGIDGKGSRMKATVRYCPRGGCPWRNAEWRWGAQQATFGRGWAKADDIVAHEYTHGVLDAEAPLFYQYQSGAINESYADVFGELIDLAHPSGRDGRWAKWKIGEDTPIGVFRDMRDPRRHGHPDRVRSPKWHTSSSDYGGVHRNSGVGNKAAFLMSAGGTFNGYTIKGIGRERTARVWYQALTTRLTPAANYIDLGDALVAACTDLAGTKGLGLRHCTAVRDATRATQMHRKPWTRAPATAPICGPAKRPLDVFHDDLEDTDSGAWAASRLVGSKTAWFWPQNPNDIPGWDGTWASSGKRNFFAPDRGSRSDAVMRMTAPVTLPARAFLRFEHGYSLDRDGKRAYDGAVVEIKVDGGPWRGVGGLFTHGKYNGNIARGTGNPIAGRRAWTGDSRGWAAARIDLSRFAGSRLKVRFRLASDRSVGARGWYIDDVRIYACANDRDRPVGAITIDGGADSTADPRVTLRLTYDDATTWVTRMRISGSPKMTSGGKLLRKGITMPARARVAWDFSDRTFGGSGGPGSRWVYAQVRDAAGNWSRVFADHIALTPP